ncbi:helix-turn-helix domain-containing protein [Brevibacterium paucivorans]|uniref:helix-turn-helix domain-containing protein n=1 Tax=Brevibacterium paucivorans TaxID=170994 RepID=UPI001EF83F38
MTYSRNRAVVLAIVNGRMSIKDASTQFGIRTRWVRTLLQRLRTGGLEELQPRSARPLTRHSLPRNSNRWYKFLAGPRRTPQHRS